MEPEIIIAGFTFALLHLNVPQEFEVWPWHRLLIDTAWGCTAATVLRHAQPSTAGWMVTTIPGFVAAVSIATVSRGITSPQTGEWLRQNPDAPLPYMWGVFETGNVVIGVVAPSILSASLLVGAFSLKNPKTRFAGAIIGLSALVPSLAVATRTPILSIAVALCFAAFLSIWIRRLRNIALVVPFAALAIVASGPLAEEAAHNLAGRFTYSDSRDERITVLSESINRIIENPFGGGMEHISAARWAHNVLLDVGLAAGILPALILLAIALFAYGFGILRLSTNEAEDFDYLVFSAAVTSGIAALTMPPTDLYYTILIFSATWFAKRQTSPVRIRTQNSSK